MFPKLRTIGDAYVAVAGLDGSSLETHITDVVKFCVLAIKSVIELSFLRAEALQVRIGVDYGPVLAGFLGSHLISYDLFGPVVSRVFELQEECDLNHVLFSERVAEVAESSKSDYQVTFSSKNRNGRQLKSVTDFDGTLTMLCGNSCSCHSNI
ncbi:hypothetical protein GEMRC1_009876 [Eukaryota sp. GEM-RC1]